MPATTRRAALAGAAALGIQPARAQPATAPFRILLNTSFSGPVSFMFLAEDRGYLRQEGVSATFAPGDGAATIVPRVTADAFDAGYGDMTALIERIAHSPPNEGPVAVYTTFNTVPFTIAVDARGPIRTPADLAGTTIVGSPDDAALRTFDVFAKATGLDPASVRVQPSPSPMGNQVADMLRAGTGQGVFGFVNTIIATSAPLGVDGRAELRFITYADALPDMYGNTLFVTRERYRADPAGITGLVRALNLGLADAAKQPGDAIDALVRRSPSASAPINQTRLVGTLRSEMAHPEGARIGVGDMDDGRLGRFIALLVAAKKLPRTPGVREVFDRSFLPPDAERIRTLAR